MKSIRQFIQNNREIIFLVVFYLCVTFVLTWVYFLIHADVIDYWESYHERLVNGENHSSNQFRLLGFWSAEIVHRITDVPIYYSYLIVRFVTTFFLLIFFHYFLTKWFSHLKSLLGVMVLVFMIIGGYLPMLQEADTIHCLFFLIGLWLIRRNNLFALILLLFVATFNKETTIFLIPFYFLVNNKKISFNSNLLRCIIMLIVWGVAFYATRFLFYEGVNASIWQLPHNLGVLKDIFFRPFLINYRFLWIPLFGMFWYLSFFDYKNKPQYLKQVAPYIVIYFIGHYISAWPEETRLLIPLALVAIPSGLYSIEKILPSK